MESFVFFSKFLNKKTWFGIRILLFLVNFISFYIRILKTILSSNPDTVLIQIPVRTNEKDNNSSVKKIIFQERRTDR